MTRTLELQLRDEVARWRRRARGRELALPGGRDFSSNDYLGLARDPRLIEAARRAAEGWGAGSTGSRLLRGNLPPHRAAEEAVAAWRGVPAALLFPSGYHANLALLTTLAAPGDTVFSDRLNHASLIDGIRLSGAAREIFHHNDLADLAERLRHHGSARRRLVVAERLYSMEGDLAPVEGLLDLCESFSAYLLLDEAHAAGVLAPLGPHPRLAATMLTGGKALGVAGAFVCGSRPLRDLLIHRGRSFVFTTAPPPAVAAALTRAVQIVRREPERARRALRRADLLRSRLRPAGVPATGDGPIVPVVLGDERRTLRVATRLREHGFDVRAIRPPTVPVGTSRLRIVCHADHTPEEIERLAAVLADAVAAEPAIPASAPAPEPVAPLVVCGTDTGVGKTVVAALLLRASRRLGSRARYLKPIQTGDASDTREVRRLADLDARLTARPVLELPLPASVDQAASAAGLEITVEEIFRACRRLSKRHAGDRWIFECAGGLRVPFNRREDQIDLLVRLRAPAILVSRTVLGTLNHTLLSLEALRVRGLAPRALFLVGPPHAANRQSLQARLEGLPIYELPLFDPLSGQALETWLEDHDLSEVLE